MSDPTLHPASPSSPQGCAEPCAPGGFPGRLLLRVLLWLEGLVLAASVGIGLVYGNMILGHWLVVILLPSLVLLGLGLGLSLWRTVFRLRSLMGWLLVLGHLAALGLGVSALRVGLRMHPGWFPAFVQQEFDLFLRAMVADDSTKEATSKVGAGFPKAVEPGNEEIGEAVAIEVPDTELGPGDSLLAKGAQGWDVLVRRESASEAVVRTLATGVRRVPLIYPDSGDAWTATGEVLLLQCQGEAVAAVTQLGLCSKRTAEPAADQGYGCEEPVVPHHLIVNLRTGKRRLLGADVGIDAALDSAQQWFKGRCAL